jgi:uncharacterized DUF497 family protein
MAPKRLKKSTVSILGGFDMKADALRFEFDESKSRSNLVKHGIDFVDAQALWLDEGFIEIRARPTVEQRYLTIGRIGDMYWSAIITYRGSAIRMISVRRSRIEEVMLYEGE